MKIGKLYILTEKQVQELKKLPDGYHLAKNPVRKKKEGQ